MIEAENPLLWFYCLYVGHVNRWERIRLCSEPVRIWYAEWETGE
jgi:hypothetical protein